MRRLIAQGHLDAHCYSDHHGQAGDRPLFDVRGAQCGRLQKSLPLAVVRRSTRDISNGKRQVLYRTVEFRAPRETQALANSTVRKLRLEVFDSFVVTTSAAGRAHARENVTFICFLFIVGKII